MLTDRQREKCREIAAALDRHDQGPWLKAEPSLGPEARGLIWDLRAHVVAAGGRAAKAAGIFAQSAQKTELRLDDLDHWASDDDQDGDGDDDDTADTVPCQACNGAGKDVTGRVCQACNGSGKVSPNDGEEDDDDDFEDD
jgi:hypothetical protein